MHKDDSRVRCRVLKEALCEAGVIGQSVLDVAIRPGGVSQRLAGNGLSVTGLCRTQEQLDACSEAFESLPVTLQLGDALALPPGLGEFDAVLALDVLGESPDWQDDLQPLLGRLRPGGRILFSARAQDHVERFAVEKSAGQGSIAIAAVQLRQAADALGLAIRSVTPCCAMDHGAFVFPAEGRILTGQHWWQRLLTWIETDPALRDFYLFLEREFFGRMPLSLSPSFVAVLEKQPDAKGNQDWLAQQAAMNAALGGKIDFAAVAQMLPEPEVWQARLAAHLATPRNRALFFHLWTALWGSAPDVDMASFLPPGQGQFLVEWTHKGMLDMWVTALARAWHVPDPFRTALVYHDVGLGSVTEYSGINNLLTACLKKEG